MAEARRRKRPDIIHKGDLASVVAFADAVLDDMGAAPNIALGPIVWGIDPGHDTRHWDFVVCCVSANNGELRIVQFKVAQDDLERAERSRDGLMMELIQRRPIVMVDFDDELAMAHWCEALSPSERSRSIRAGKPSGSRSRHYPDCFLTFFTGLGVPVPGGVARQRLEKATG